MDTLFADVSRRVLGIMTQFSLRVEYDRVDEMFLELPQMAHNALVRLAERLCSTVSASN